jgi:hypothetical protein
MLPFVLLERLRYLRLEVLEGLVAFHTGDVEGADKILARAHNKWKSLQVRRFVKKVR